MMSKSTSYMNPVLGCCRLKTPFMSHLIILMFHFFLLRKDGMFTLLYVSQRFSSSYITMTIHIMNFSTVFTRIVFLFCLLYSRRPVRVRSVACRLQLHKVECICICTDWVTIRVRVVFQEVNFSFGSFWCPS